MQLEVSFELARHMGCRPVTGEVADSWTISVFRPIAAAISILAFEVLVPKVSACPRQLVFGPHRKASRSSCHRSPLSLTPNPSLFTLPTLLVASEQRNQSRCPGLKPLIPTRVLCRKAGSDCTAPLVRPNLCPNPPGSQSAKSQNAVGAG